MLSIRPYKKCDAKTVVRWLTDERSFRMWCKNQYATFPITADDMNHYYEEKQQRDNFFVMVAEEDGELVGHFVMRYLDEARRVLRLGFIIVDGTKRGKGYGSRMMRGALRYAFNILKVERVTVCVFDNNPAAIACYRKCGYKESTPPNVEMFEFFGEKWCYREFETTMCQAVVFDMDGVIFDSESLVLECWRTVADKYNIPDVDQNCSDCRGLNYEATKEYYLNKFGADFDYVGYKKEVSALFHEKAAKGELRTKWGIEELLYFLKINNIPMAVASSTRSDVVKQELENAGLLQYFDAIVGGDQVIRSKPDPEIYLKACEMLGCNPKYAYAIEDSFNGVRSAVAAGMPTIMVPDLTPADDEMKKICKVVLENHIDVANYLRNWIW